MRGCIYQFTVSEDIANQFIRLRGLLLSSAFSPPPPPPPPPPSLRPPLSAVFKRNILKETLFPDYRALYRRTRKYKFWPRHPKSHFLSLSLTVTCLEPLKDTDIMVFVMLRSASPNLTFLDVDSCKGTNEPLQTFISATEEDTRDFSALNVTF